MIDQLHMTALLQIVTIVSIVVAVFTVVYYGLMVLETYFSGAWWTWKKSLVYRLPVLLMGVAAQVVVWSIFGAISLVRWIWS